MIQDQKKNKDFSQISHKRLILLHEDQRCCYANMHDTGTGQDTGTGEAHGHFLMAKSSYLARLILAIPHRLSAQGSAVTQSWS